MVLIWPVALPLVIMAAVLTALSGHKPFYLDSRVGRNGRVFRMIKIRTMVENADQALKDYLAENPGARREWTEKQKLEHDPRVTPFGDLLRRTSLDELPQIWNVLTGEMSIVGPRPMMPDQTDIYPGTAYYDLRPGITGPWQISARSEGSFAGRAVFDTEYSRTLSLGNDLLIIARTVRAVMKCTGR